MAKNKGGRPTVMTEEKIRQFKAICRMKPSLEDCCAFLDCGQDTIIRYCKSIGESFASFRDKNMVHTRFGLIRTAIKKAENGDNTMLIFCLKNLCGWADKIDRDDTPSNIKISFVEATEADRPNGNNSEDS